MSNIFITGAAGFIGSNLADRLLKYGHNVTALVGERQSSCAPCNNLNVAKGDILDKSFLLKATKGIDTLYHCAAFISFSQKYFKKSYKINVEGTKNVLEASLNNGVKKVVHLSAASVLGYTKNPKEIINEYRDFRILYKNSYSYTKKLAEDVVKDYTRRGLDISIANIATVYGKGDRKMNSGSIIKGIYKNQIKFVPPGGTSYICMQDLIPGLIVLSEKGRRGERYIFSSENLTFFELFNRIAKALRSRPIRFIIPRWTFVPMQGMFFLKDVLLDDKSGKVNVLTQQIVKESYFYKYYSFEKAHKELGWKPQFSLEEGVTEALEFYIKEKLI